MLNPKKGLGRRMVRFVERTKRADGRRLIFTELLDVPKGLRICGLQPHPDIGDKAWIWAYEASDRGTGRDVTNLVAVDSRATIIRRVQLKEE